MCTRVFVCLYSIDFTVQMRHWMYTLSILHEPTAIVRGARVTRCCCRLNNKFSSLFALLHFFHPFLSLFVSWYHFFHCSHFASLSNRQMLQCYFDRNTIRCPLQQTRQCFVGSRWFDGHDIQHRKKKQQRTENRNENGQVLLDRFMFCIVNLRLIALCGCIENHHI